MTILHRATDASERMDAPDADRDDLTSALNHIVAVNRWLGARRALRRHLAWGLGGARGGTARVLDVGTGSGDLAFAMIQWAEKRDRPVHVTALELHAATLDAARLRPSNERLALVRGDGLRLPFGEGTFDLVHLAMILHHMDGPALTDLLREAGRVARGGRILVGELERSLPNYIGARLLAASVWRQNPITRHDGPLSVLRAFTTGELLELAREAELLRPAVHRHPFYRLVLRAEA